MLVPSTRGLSCKLDAFVVCETMHPKNVEEVQPLIRFASIR